MKDHFRAELFGHEAINSFAEIEAFLLVQDHNFIAIIIITLLKGLIKAGMKNTQ